MGPRLVPKREVPLLLLSFLFLRYKLFLVLSTLPARLSPRRCRDEDGVFLREREDAMMIGSKTPLNTTRACPWLVVGSSKEKCLPPTDNEDP